jgi:hypothetical protein
MYPNPKGNDKENDCYFTIFNYNRAFFIAKKEKYLLFCTDFPLGLGYGKANLEC